MSDERTKQATQAYVYGFPMVFDLEQVQRFTGKGMGALAPAPFNTFSHAGALASERDTFVSVNNDTLYSIAQLDLSVGPVVVHVPDVGERYYVLQHVDAWTNNFAYLGTRATGSAAGTYVYVPPGFDGALPDGATPIHCPTTVCTIVGRFAVEQDADDVAAVAALQAQLVLEPVDADAEPAGLPVPAEVGDDLRFWEQLRTWLAAFPPAPSQSELVEGPRPLGLLDEESPYVDPDPELAADLKAGYDAGKALIEQLTRGASSGGGTPGAWPSLAHVFDYNDDFFEVGTIDSPEWRISEPQKRYATRAIAALAGLWGNHGYEALYSPTYTDSTGEALDGSHRYRLRLPQEPPVDAFWSITMYDATDYYLVANPIDRFTIGDRTPGIVRGDDGSLTIAIQHDEPTDPDERANWLPAPAGTFRPMLRIYQPQEALFDGSYVVPPIEHID